MAQIPIAARRRDQWIRHQIRRRIELCATFALASVSALALTLNAAFIDEVSNAWLGVVLISLIMVHLIRLPKLPLYREYAAYLVLVAYMFVQTLWTEDMRLAVNTLLPAVNSVLVLFLFGSLVSFYNLHAVLVGFLCGILTGAGFYTLTTGFPFVRPLEFSYNAIAGMYLFGLFITLLLLWYRRAYVSLLAAAVMFLFLIVATTSIKVNLGILFGTVAAAVVYVGQLVKVIRKSALALIMIGGVLGYLVVSNDELMDTVQSGYERVVLGVEILEARENLPGYSGWDNRRRWIRDGLAGWQKSPVYGHGVEAFRSHYGITSHTTAIDLLYNSGLIGFSLFYYIFLSLVWRALVMRDRQAEQLTALVFAATVCYLSITLSGLMHYNVFLAAFLATSLSLFARLCRSEPRVVVDKPLAGVRTLF